MQILLCFALEWIRLRFVLRINLCYAQFVLRIRLPVNHAPTTFRPALDRSSMSNRFSEVSDSLQKTSRHIGNSLSDFI